MLLQEKRNRLQRLLQDWGQVGLAFSGGLDSSLLLHLALETLGPENLCILHARSSVQRRLDIQGMDQWQEEHPHLVHRLRLVAVQPLLWPDFVANPPNRCYICKRHLYTEFLEILAQEGIFQLMDGTQGDDLQQGAAARPGLLALAELGIKTPLAVCGFTKAEIRQLSRDLGLSTWNKPSSSCLATRIPAGMPIEAKLLAQVEQLEQAVLDLGFRDCRIRPLWGAAGQYTVQLSKEDLARAFAMQEQIRQSLKSQGLVKLFLDLDGR